MSLAPFPAIDQRRKVAVGGPTPKGALRRLFSFPLFLGALLLAGVFITVRLNLEEVQSLPNGSYHVSIFEGDTWYHILMGEQILRTHRWPVIDSYSFTAQGNESFAFEWLGQVILALTDRLGGLRALTGLLIALATTLMLLLFYYVYLRCQSSKAAFVACLPMLPLVSAFFTLRPQLLGYIFLLLTLICLERFHQGQFRALWFLPLIFLIWVNTHGSFILGLVVLGASWAGGLVEFEIGGLKAVKWKPQQRRQLLMAALLSLLTLAITPYGTRVAGFTLHVILNAPLGMTFITEYAPLGTFGSLLKGFLALLLIFLLDLVIFRPTYRLEEMGLLVVAIYGACVHVRLLLFFVFVFAPLFAMLLAPWVPPYDASKDHHFLNAVLMLLICVGIVGFFPTNQELEKVVARGFPGDAVTYLRHHPVPGPMFNEDLWGAYLIRSLGPTHKVFIDGRSQLYEESGVFADYLRIMAIKPDTQILLRKYDVKACLIERGAPLATLLASSVDWQRVYQDGLSVLFVRKG